MKKKLFLAFAVVLIGVPFAFSTEASAKECQVGPCPCGYYFKKGGSNIGKPQSAGMCIPMGNIGKMPYEVW